MNEYNISGTCSGHSYLWLLVVLTFAMIHRVVSCTYSSRLTFGSGTFSGSSDSDVFLDFPLPFVHIFTAGYTLAGDNTKHIANVKSTTIYMYIVCTTIR